MSCKMMADHLFGYRETTRSRDFYPTGKRLIIDVNDETDMITLQLEGEEKKYKIERCSKYTLDAAIDHNFGKGHNRDHCIFCEVKRIQCESNALKSLVE